MAVVFCQIEAPRASVPAGETHVYTAPLRDPDPLLPSLTTDEHARAARFRLPQIRDPFIAARGYLRRLLGHYLRLGPRDVPVRYADGGKPYLPAEFGLEFNLSHTAGLAVIAVGRARLGVDVERARPVPDADALVNRFFSRREAEQFRSLPIKDRPGAFLRAWTRKEAVLKAIGRGVQSLDCCDVTFADGQPPALVSLDGDATAGTRWEVFAWEPAAGYLAAGAVERPMQNAK